jgi:hypothetical protein
MQTLESKLAVEIVLEGVEERERERTYLVGEGAIHHRRRQRRGGTRSFPRGKTRPAPAQGRCRM